MSAFGYILVQYTYYEIVKNLIHCTVVMSMGAVIIALGLGSIVFLSTIFMVIALLIRNRWDDMGRSDDRRKSR